MSRKKEKQESKEIPVDHITEVKNLQFTISLKENEIADLKKINSELNQRNIFLTKENSEYKSSVLNSFKNEKELKQLKDQFDYTDNENRKLKEELKMKTKMWEDELEETRKRYEHELWKMKSTLENYHQKIESVNALQAEKTQKEEKILQLELEKDKIRIEADEKMKYKEVRNQMKFSDLKKKMIENIQETQKNVTQMNIEYMDVSTKLTLLQNHQLLIQVEYQSQQISDLLKKKEGLEKKLFELTKDLEIHREVEIVLAEKNKKLGDKLKQLTKKEEEEEEGSSQCVAVGVWEREQGIDSIHVNSSSQDISILTSLEKKIMGLEKSLKKKTDEYQKLKSNFDFIEYKLKSYETKYHGLFLLFEEGLAQFYEDEDFTKNNPEIYLHLDNIKTGDYSKLSKEEKYTVLVILMKHLLPLVNESDLSKVPNGNVNTAKRENVYQKYIDDPILKKVFQTKKNLIEQSLKRSLEKLPAIGSHFEITVLNNKIK